MSQERAQDIVSFKAQDTLSAYCIVAIEANNGVALADTSTAMGFGLSRNAASLTGEAVSVVISGTGKVLCGASVSAGAIVTWQTTTAYAIEAVTAFIGTAATVIPRSIGLALEAGSTNSVIEILIRPNWINKTA